MTVYKLLNIETSLYQAGQVQVKKQRKHCTQIDNDITIPIQPSKEKLKI